METLKIQKRKGLLLVVAALMLASMMFAAVVPAIAQGTDDADALQARTWICVAYDDQGVCIRWVQSSD